jgi:ribosomal protein S18 acetylase RimI-like enzyme
LTPAPFVIRAARPDDRAAVLALIPRLRAFGAPPLRSPEAMDAGEVRTLERYFDAEPESVFLRVAEASDGAILGLAYGEQATDYFTLEAHGHLGILAVAEGAEGRGVGRALLAEVERWAAACGYRFLTLNVFTDNTRAIQVYERAGYRAESVRYLKEMEPPAGA